MCRAVNRSETDSAITAGGIGSAKLVLLDKPVLLAEVSPDSCLGFISSQRWKFAEVKVEASLN